MNPFDDPNTYAPRNRLAFIALRSQKGFSEAERVFIQTHFPDTERKNTWGPFKGLSAQQIEKYRQFLNDRKEKGKPDFHQVDAENAAPVIESPPMWLRDP